MALHHLELPAGRRPAARPARPQQTLRQPKVQRGHPGKRLCNRCHRRPQRHRDLRQHLGLDLQQRSARRIVGRLQLHHLLGRSTGSARREQRPLRDQLRLAGRLQRSAPRRRKHEPRSGVSRRMKQRVDLPQGCLFHQRIARHSGHLRQQTEHREQHLLQAEEQRHLCTTTRLQRGQRTVERRQFAQRLPHNSALQEPRRQRLVQQQTAAPLLQPGSLVEHRPMTGSIGTRLGRRTPVCEQLPTAHPVHRLCRDLHAAARCRPRGTPLGIAHRECQTSPEPPARCNFDPATSHRSRPAGSRDESAAQSCSDGTPPPSGRVGL